MRRLMLRRYLEQRHIDLDSGRSCLALEREYWQALEVLAYEDGWSNWPDFFYMRVLPDKPEDISLASHVRLVVVKLLFVDYQFNGSN
jgi:predicted DNA-binding ribbon-helix-helix protein